MSCRTLTAVVFAAILALQLSIADAHRVGRDLGKDGEVMLPGRIPRHLLPTKNKKTRKLSRTKGETDNGNNHMRSLKGISRSLQSGHYSTAHSSSSSKSMMMGKGKGQQGITINTIGNNNAGKGIVIPELSSVEPTSTVSPSATLEPETGSGNDNGMCMLDCEELSFKFFLNEVNEGRAENAIGDTLEYMLYDPDTDEYVGFYQDVSTFFPGNFNDCLFYSVYSFDIDEATELYHSQIIAMGSCSGATNSVVGGTGAYAGATGFDSFVETGNTEFGIVNLHICLPPCFDQKTDG